MLIEIHIKGTCISTEKWAKNMNSAKSKPKCEKMLRIRKTKDMKIKLLDADLA